MKHLSNCPDCHHQPVWMLFDVQHKAYCSHDCHRGNTSALSWYHNLEHISGTASPEDPAVIRLVKVYETRKFFDP